MYLNMAFNPYDPLNFESQLNDAEKATALNARNFATNFLAPRIREAFRTEKMDTALLPAMGQHQLLGAAIATEYGGSNLNAVSYGLIAREIERIDSGYRTILSVTSSLVMRAIDLFGSPTQKNKYLPLLAQGKLIASFGLTEPQHGSDPNSMESYAKKNTTGYCLNGHKRWIGLAPYADILIYWAKDQDGIIRGFILERGLKGMHTPQIEGKWSLRSAPTGEIILTDAMVTIDALLPNAQGLKAPLSCLDAARFGISWGVLGAAENCFDIALNYAKQRQQFGKPIAATQLVQQKLVNMRTEITLALHACLAMGRNIDAGQGNSAMISMMKRNSVKKALEIARLAREILGGNGILEEYDVIRHLLNLESVNTYEGTEDIHTLILGRALTSFQAFK